MPGTSAAALEGTRAGRRAGPGHPPTAPGAGGSDKSDVGLDRQVQIHPVNLHPGPGPQGFAA